MRTAQFDESRGTCVFFDVCFPGTSRPFSRTGFADIGLPWVVQGRHWLGSWYGIAVTGGESLVGATFGQKRDTTTSLKIEYRVMTVAPLFVVRPEHGVFAGAGPSFIATTFTATGSGGAGGEQQVHRKVGATLEVGVSVPSDSRFAGEFVLQYHYAGRMEAGPFTAVGRTTPPPVLPVASVVMNHWIAGFGAALRF